METFFCCNPLGIILQSGSLYIFPSHFLWATALSFLVLLAGCYAFELFSLVTGKGHYELLDIVAGMFGGAIGIGAVLLFWYYIV